MSEQKDASDSDCDEYECIHGCHTWQEIEQEQKRYDVSSGPSLRRCITIPKRRGVPFFGCPKHYYYDDTTYTDIVEKIMDREWFIMAIKCTISHAEYNEDNGALQKMRDSGFGENDKTVDLLKGYFVICNEVGAHNHNITQIHNHKDFLGVPRLSVIMPRWKLRFIERHFRITDIFDLPIDKNHPDWKPYQNIEAGIDMLRNKSIALWKLGNLSSYDEGRVVAKSKRVGTASRNPHKPITNGQDISFVSDQSEYSCGFCWGYIIPQKKY